MPEAGPSGAGCFVKEVLSFACVNECVEHRTLATNLSIDPELLDKALEIDGEKTKKATVTKALREFIARREQKKIMDLFGTLEWNDDFDYKHERSRR